MGIPSAPTSHLGFPGLQPAGWGASTDTRAPSLHPRDQQSGPPPTLVSAAGAARPRMRPGPSTRPQPGRECPLAFSRLSVSALPVRVPVPWGWGPCSPTGSLSDRGPWSSPSWAGRQRLRGWPEATLSPSHQDPSGGGRVPTAQAMKMRLEGLEQLRGSRGDGEQRAAQGRGSWAGLGVQAASEPHPPAGGIARHWSPPVLAFGVLGGRPAPTLNPRLLLGGARGLSSRPRGRDGHGSESAGGLSVCVARAEAEAGCSYFGELVQR